MKYFGEGLSEKHKELAAILRKKDQLQPAKEQFLSLHGYLHPSKVSGMARNEVDELLNDLKPKEYAIMPSKKDETIAWALWHTARIEDLTMNVLVNQGETVFQSVWQQKLNLTKIDTGNTWTDEEIIQMSKTVNVTELLEYRLMVAARTREIVTSLEQDDMRRKVKQEDLQRISQLGGVTEEANSKGLLEYWGGKDVAGLLLMPPTRHVILHINDCSKWKGQIRIRRQFYLE